MSDLASWADTAAYAIAPAIARFNATCQQWYLTTGAHGLVKVPLPNGTELPYEVPNPVPCGKFTVKAFDAGHIPYDCRFTISGDCQP